jgi:hypothetical protein
MPSHRITVSPTGALEGGSIGGAENAAVRHAIGRYFVIPAAGTMATTMAAPAPVDVLVPPGEEEDGTVVIGRKRAHSVAGATGSDRSAATAATAAGRDRWRE